jgi:hypothetical protein
MRAGPSWSEPRNLGRRPEWPRLQRLLSAHARRLKTAYFSSSPTVNGTKDICAAGRSRAAGLGGQAGGSGRFNENCGRFPERARAGRPHQASRCRAPNCEGRAAEHQQNQPAVQLHRALRQHRRLPAVAAGRQLLPFSASGAGLLTMGDTLKASGSPRRDLLLLPAAVGAIRWTCPASSSPRAKPRLLPFVLHRAEPPGHCPASQSEHRGAP